MKDLPHKLSTGEVMSLGDVLRDLTDNQESLLKMIDKQRQRIDKLESRIHRMEQNERRLNLAAR